MRKSWLQILSLGSLPFHTSGGRCMFRHLSGYIQLPFSTFSWGETFMTCSSHLTCVLFVLHSMLSINVSESLYQSIMFDLLISRRNAVLCISCLYKKSYDQCYKILNLDSIRNFVESGSLEGLKKTQKTGL